MYSADGASHYHHPPALTLQPVSLLDGRAAWDGLVHVGMSRHCPGNTFTEGTYLLILKIMILSWFSIQGQLVAGNENPNCL